MEALAAVSLAGNIIQFVEFAHKLLSSCESLYHSKSGRLAVNAELELITTDLRALIPKWRNARTSGSVGDLTCLTQAQSEDQKRFESICDGAEDIAREIITRLESLKMKGKKFHILDAIGWQTMKGRKGEVKETIKMAVKSLWTKEELDGLVERLMGFKQALQTGVIFKLRCVLQSRALATRNLTS